MYEFRRINHPIILTHTVLISLTPLIPIPFVDDWIKAGLQRRMVRQICAARGFDLRPAEVEALIQEDFWSSCAEGCLYIFLRLLREIASKIFFWIEWRRAFNLLSITYYTGFLLDTALLDGYPLQGPPDAPPEAAARLREAIRRARYGANPRLIQRVFRQNVRPLAMLGAAWQLARRALSALPGLLAGLPKMLWHALRGAPGHIRDTILMRVHVLLGKQKPPEIQAVERIAQAMQEALLSMDSAHFDELRDRLHFELAQERPQPGNPK
jgi:hypothetical protein